MSDHQGELWTAIRVALIGLAVIALIAGLVFLVWWGRAPAAPMQYQMF